jgi:hypothetical protein
MDCPMLLSLLIKGGIHQWEGIEPPNNDMDTTWWRSTQLLNKTKTLYSMIEHYKNTTKCSKIEVVIGETHRKTCDSLQVLCHPKYNTLYVALYPIQKGRSKTWHYRVPYNIVMQYVNRNDAILSWIFFKNNSYENKEYLI